MDDGAVRIFLNTRGKNDDEITPELKAFLHYVECTEDKFVENSGSERLKKIHACVSQIKFSLPNRRWIFWTCREKSGINILYT